MGSFMGSMDEMRMIRYHSEHDQADAICKQTDELMIANMINLLNNPNLWQILTESEKQTILSAVRNHVVMKANFAKAIQEDLIRNSEKKMGF